MATRTTKHIDRVATPGLNPVDLLALIVRERSKDVDTVEPGFHRVEHWSKLWDMERTRTIQMLVYAVQKGLAECKTYKIMCGSKRCPVKHYRQKG